LKYIKKSKYRANRQEAVPFERHRIQNNGKTIELCVDRKPVGFRVVGKVPKLFKTRNDTDFLRKEVKLVKTRLRKWYIAIPVAIGIEECDQEDMCALDPGVRTFQTVYGTDGAVSHVGTGFDAIEKELLKADKLLSEKSKNETLSPRQRRKQGFDLVMSALPFHPPSNIPNPRNDVQIKKSGMSQNDDLVTLRIPTKTFGPCTTLWLQSFRCQ